MKKNLLFLLLSFIGLKLFAQNTDSVSGPLSLKQCIEIAIANNIDVKRSEFQSENAKANLQQARGQMLPFTRANISHSLNQGRSIDPFTNGYIDQKLTSANYGLDASITLWNGSSIQNNIKQNALTFQASKMDVQQEKDNLTINVILAYLQVLNNQEQLALAKQQADVSRKQVERLEILNKEGAIAPYTYYDTKGELATNELNVVTTKNALETAKVTLAQLMNVPYSADMQFEKTGEGLVPVVYDATIEQIYQEASEHLALVKAAELRSESAEKGVKTAKGLLLPSLTLNGGLGTNYSSAAALSQLIDTKFIATDNYVLLNDDKLPVYAPQPSYSSQKIAYGKQWKNNFNSFVSVGLSVPILNGLSARSQLNKAKILERSTSYEEKTTKLQLRQAIEQAYVNMNAAYQRYLTLNEQVKAFGESFRAAQVRFDAGVITSVDYLTVKRNYDAANTNLIAARYDYILRTKILDYYQSKPLW